MNLTQNDILDLFIQDLEEKNIFEYCYIPSKLIYIYYKTWFNNNNFNSKLMKPREFGQYFSKKIKNKGYNRTIDKRINSINNYLFNKKLLIKNTNIISNDMSKIFINDKNAIKDEDVFSILNEVKTIDELKDYPLPTIQYFIEEFSNQRLNLFSNIDLIEDIYYLNKKELINKLK